MAHIEYPGLPTEYVMEMVHKFYDEYYFRPSVAWRIVRDALWNAGDRKRLTQEAIDFLALGLPTKRPLGRPRAAPCARPRIAEVRDPRDAGRAAQLTSHEMGDVGLRRRQDDVRTRTPDLIVQPQPGTIYSTSKAKAAEHGGFAPEDTHVALLVVGGRLDDREDAGRTVGTPVQTTQIAPTILEYLGLEPQRLKSVRLEGTEALPR